MKKTLRAICVGILSLLVLPLVILICLIALVAWPIGALRRYFFPPPERETKMGLFTRNSPMWSTIQPPRFYVVDREGEPDPEFLARLPEIRDNASEIRRMAEESLIFQEFFRTAEGTVGLVAISQIWIRSRPDWDYVMLFGEEGAEDQDCVEVAVRKGQIVQIQRA
jgi:hypothetical protein